MDKPKPSRYIDARKGLENNMNEIDFEVLKDLIFMKYEGEYTKKGYDVLEEIIESYTFFRINSNDRMQLYRLMIIRKLYLLIVKILN